MKRSAVALLIYAFLLFAGGIIGYILKESKASLISGSGCAILFLGNAIWMLYTSQKKKSIYPFYLALLLSFLLDGFFTYRWILTQQFFPAGALSFVTLILVIILAIANKKLVNQEIT